MNALEDRVRLVSFWRDGVFNAMTMQALSEDRIYEAYAAAFVRLTLYALRGTRRVRRAWRVLHALRVEIIRRGDPRRALLG